MNNTTLIINKGSCADLLVVFEDDSGAIDLTGFTVTVTDCVPASLQGITCTVTNPLAGEVEMLISETVAQTLRLGDNWFRLSMTSPDHCTETTNRIRLLVE